MAETQQRGRVIRALTALNAVPVENPALPGTPDVNYTEGWIELKWLRDWPAKAETTVTFRHFTPQQRVWHMRRRTVGGRTWVLIQCKREWILLDGMVAALHLNHATREELYELANKRTTKGLDAEELQGWISQRQKPYLLSDGERELLRKRLLKGMGSLASGT